MTKKELKEFKQYYKDSGLTMTLPTQYWVAKCETEHAQAEYHEKLSMEKHLGKLVDVGCAKYGCREFGDLGEEWMNWWVFPATMTDKAIDKAMEDLGVGEHYSGVGRAFCQNYGYHRQGSRVLVTQIGGYDV